MSLTEFHPSWDKILTQNLQAVADQGCHLEGSSSYKGNALSYKKRPSNWTSGSSKRRDLSPQSNFAEIEVPASLLASLFSVTTSLEQMLSPPEKGRQARLSVEQKKNKLSELWVF
jgi:hypothetical protein